uniref:Retrotransposon gag domain-containing protein n=1 Tax=Tanacetum cinerariifolium TaxID=118510 RepID=A0A6L2KAR4_TANCI|nr:hypothetical protein [Tanacetum cinerariifolium]
MFDWETTTCGKVRYFEDIDYFKNFETKFPPIVYEEASTSESEFSPEPTGYTGANQSCKLMLLLPGIIMSEGEIDNLTMEQYLALTQGNQDTFFRNKNDDAHEHVKQVLDIVSLFNILAVRHDAIMIRVFPITLTRAAKRWVDRHSPGTFDSWDLLKKAFIQRYCPSSKTDKQLEDIRNFKQEGNKTLYQAWEREAYLDKECPLNEEVKSVEEVKYEEFGRPFPNNSRNDEAAKRHAEQDKWLKKLYQNTETNREAHDKIIQGLETKVRTLTNKVEGRTNGGKLEECNAICYEDGSPLYTPFYYSHEEIGYFYANLRFSDNERQETDKSGIKEALAALKATLEV